MKKNQIGIKKFRSLLADRLVKKGISPPNPGSDKELELYYQWLEGREKLQKSDE